MKFLQSFDLENADSHGNLFTAEAIAEILKTAPDVPIYLGSAGHTEPIGKIVRGEIFEDRKGVIELDVEIPDQFDIYKSSRAVTFRIDEFETDGQTRFIKKARIDSISITQANPEVSIQNDSK